MSRKRWGALVISLCAAALFFLLVFWWSDVEWKDVCSALSEAGLPALGLVVAAMTGQIFLQSFSWMLLRGPDCPIRFLHALAATFAGWSGNFATPSMYLGGEPLRAYALSKASGIPFRRTMGSVMAHKFIEFASFLIFILLSAVLAFCGFRHLLSRDLLCALALCLVFLVSLFGAILTGILFRRRFFSPAAEMLIRLRIAPGKSLRALPKIREMEDSILELFFSRRRACLHSLAWMFGFHSLCFLRPILFFPFLGTEAIGLGELALLFLLIQLLQAVQLTPGGIGILEGGLIGVFGLLGVPAAQALGYAAFCRIGDAVVVSTGFAVPFYLGMAGFRGEPEQRGSDVLAG